MFVKYKPQYIVKFCKMTCRQLTCHKNARMRERELLGVMEQVLPRTELETLVAPRAPAGTTDTTGRAVSSSKCNRVNNLTPVIRRAKCAFW